MSLGLSFAAAGFRTLLIDADLSSRQLTRAFNADDAPGMAEATAGETPAIRRVRAGLSVLTAGRCRPQDACRVAPGATGRVLAGIRDRFDVVLIDSEPILTGLTASVIAPQVDGVILALASGQEPAALNNAVTRIERLGARIAGAVFNRAPSSDFRTTLDAHSGGVAARPLPERLARFGALAGTMLASLSLSREDDLELLSDGMSLARSDDAKRAAA